MVKVALAADLHLFPHREFSTLVNGIPSRLLDCVSALAKIRAACVERRISCLVVAGDIFHRRGSIQTLVYNLAVRELVAFKRAGIRVLVNEGNHDMADRGGLVHAVEALERSGLVEGIKVGRGWAIWRHEDLTISGFSYCDDRALLERRLEKCRKARGREEGIGVLHHGFKGARVGTHLEYVVKEPLSAKRIFAGHDFAYVWSGHYHADQPILGFPNARYIGSPMEFTRATRDARGEKGFKIYDSETNDYEPVPLEFPMFVETSTDALQNDPQAAWFAVDGNFVDVTFEDYPGGKERLIEDLKAGGARGWKITKKGRSVKRSERQEIDPKTPPAEALAAYLETKSDAIAEIGGDAAEVLRVGIEILSEASERER